MTTATRERKGRSQMFRDGAASLSLANLCFIGSWNNLLDGSPKDAFNVYNYYSFVTIMLNVLLLGAVFWTAVTLARRSESSYLLKIGGWLLPLLLLIPLNGVLTILLPDVSLLKMFAWLKVGQFNSTELMVIGPVLVIPGAMVLARRFKLASAAVASGILLLLGRPEPVWFALLLTIFLLLVLARWRMRIVPVISTLLLVLAPFVLITFFQASSYARKFEDRPPAQRLERAPNSARVVWMVFDEMDQAMTFSRRHPTLKLPEIDRLRDQAIYASNAYPPADYTLLSMPAMISGRLVSKAKAAGPGEVMITYADSNESVPWSSQPSIFSEARELGVNSAVIGWYHPYCRIVGQSLASCSYHGIGQTPFGESMSQHLKTLARTVPLSSYYQVFQERDPFQLERRRRFKDAYVAMMEQSKKAVVDPNLGLTLLHWPIPHPPAIFNHFTGDFDLTMQSGYVGNLSLVDRTIGELRREMENAGLWDNTTVLITSDHWFRPEIHFRTKEDDEALAGQTDHRVPFLLKLAGQGDRVDYDREFNNVLVHDLLLAMLSGELKSIDSVLQWLDSHRTIGESPYYFERLK